MVPLSGRRVATAVVAGIWPAHFGSTDSWIARYGTLRQKWDKSVPDFGGETCKPLRIPCSYIINPPTSPPPLGGKLS
jgi:hypothetical protein